MNEASKKLPPDAVATLRGPAVAANRFYVVPGDAGVRVAFSEQTLDGMEFEFRAAVILSRKDAQDLWRLLGEALQLNPDKSNV